MKIKQLRKYISNKLASLADEVPYLAHAAIGSHMSDWGASASWKEGGSGAAVEAGKNPTDILRTRSGRLLGSFLPKSDESTTDINYRANKISGEIGTEVVYARIHDVGGMAGRGRSVRIPKRPYFTPGIEDLQKKIDGEIDNLIDDVISKFRKVKIK